MPSAIVKIRLSALLQDHCGCPGELKLAAESLRGVLGELERHHPALYRSVCDETGAVRRHVNLFVNASHARDRAGLDTPLTAGDVVTILQSVSGG
jgi:molybdopterin converting factor small subunit